MFATCNVDRVEIWNSIDMELHVRPVEWMNCYRRIEIKVRSARWRAVHYRNWERRIFHLCFGHAFRSTCIACVNSRPMRSSSGYCFLIWFFSVKRLQFNSDVMFQYTSAINWLKWIRVSSCEFILLLFFWLEISMFHCSLHTRARCERGAIELRVVAVAKLRIIAGFGFGLWVFRVQKTPMGRATR